MGSGLIFEAAHFDIGASLAPLATYATKCSRNGSGIRDLVLQSASKPNRAEVCGVGFSLEFAEAPEIFAAIGRAGAGMRTFGKGVGSAGAG